MLISYSFNISSIRLCTTLFDARASRRPSIRKIRFIKTAESINTNVVGLDESKISIILASYIR